MTKEKLPVVENANERGDKKSLLIAYVSTSRNIALFRSLQRRAKERHEEAPPTYPHTIFIPTFNASDACHARTSEASSSRAASAGAKEEDDFEAAYKDYTPVPCENLSLLVAKPTEELASLVMGTPAVSVRNTVPANSEQYMREARARALSAAAIQSAGIPCLTSLQNIFRTLDRRRVAAQVDDTVENFNVRRELDEKLLTNDGSGGKGGEEDGRGDCGMNRSEEEVDGEREMVECLPWALLEYTDSVDTLRAKLHHVGYPAILKRRLAGGSRTTHEVVVTTDFLSTIAALRKVFSFSVPNIAINEDCVDDPAPPPAAAAPADGARDWSLRKLLLDATYRERGTRDVLAQRFVRDHGEVTFKVYAVGPRAFVGVRASVCVAAGGGSIFTYVDGSTFKRNTRHAFDDATGRSETSRARMPSARLVAALQAGLQDEMQLGIFGFDVIFDVERGVFHVVDVNYLPSFRDVPHAADWMLEYFVGKVGGEGLGDPLEEENE